MKIEDKIKEMLNEVGNKIERMKFICGSVKDRDLKLVLEQGIAELEMEIRELQVIYKKLCKDKWE